MSYKPIHIENGYTVEFDTVDKHEWYNIIQSFSDSNIYQTWSYDEIRCGSENLSHFILRKSDKIIAAAQARLQKLPVIRLTAAYVRWGPLWQRWNESTDPGVFGQVVRSLRDEYVRRRGYILRIFPIMYDDKHDNYFDILQKEGFRRVPGENRSRTIIVDIQPSMEELRKNLHQKWRNCLNKAERNKLEVIEGVDDNLFRDFIEIYRELLQRKKFKEPNDINEFRAIQKELPKEYKMRLFLCRSEGICSAGAIFTAIGDTGVYLFGATNAEGIKNNGSYLLQWKAIKWMKNKGCRYYNLNGINPEENPGSYRFKSRLSGKSGKDVYYLGRFDCYSGVVSTALGKCANLLYPQIKKITSV